MRKIAVMVLCIICTVLCNQMNAQSYKEHIVKDGETTASIAQAYSISTEDLVNANPALQNYCYVGMKLRIPESKSNDESEETKTEPIAPPVVQENTKELTLFELFSNTIEPPCHWTTAESKVRHLTTAGMLGVSCAYGTAYYLTENLHLDALIGFDFSTVSNDYITTKSDYVVLPLEVNYNIYFSNKKINGFYLTPYVGVNYSYLVKSEVKIDDTVEKVDPSNRYGFAHMLGIKVKFMVWGLHFGLEFNNNSETFFFGFVIGM